MTAISTTGRGAIRPCNPEYIWITDQVLANAFGRFLATSCQTRKRWGSSVPGPLEAQRRLAKRRMVNVAVIGDRPVLDVATMSGYGPAMENGCWKWEAPTRLPTTSTPAKTVQPALPAWLEGYQSLSCHSVPPKLPRRNLTGLGAIAGECSRQSFLERAAALKDRLRSVSCTDGVRQAFFDLSIDAHRAPLYSSFAFRTLLSMETRTDVLADYLTDPALNASEAWNLESVILHYAGKGFVGEAWQELMHIIKRVVTSGIVSDDEIRSILRVVPDVVAKPHADGSSHMEQCISFLQTIWGGIQSSHVSSVHELDARTLDLMLFQLSQISFTTANCSMAIDIIRAASPCQLSHMNDGISSYLVGWAHNWRNQEVVVQHHAADFVCIPHMLDLVDSLPLPVARSSISAALERLLTSKPSGTSPEAQSNVLHPWIATIALAERRMNCLLTDAEWQSIELKLDMRYNNDKITRYLSNFDARGKSRFFFRRWVPRVLDLTVGRGASVSLPVQRRFQELCEGSSINASYYNIVLAHHQLKLPYHRILRSLLAFLSDFCTREAKLRTITLLVRSGFVRPTPGRKNATPDLRGRGSFRLLQFCKSDTYLSFDSDTDLASPMAGSDTELADKVLHFLRPSPSPSSPPLGGIDQDLSVASMSRVDFLHKLALSFAHSSHVSARLAFRHVYRCYLFLRHRQVTLQADLSRALVQAGVTRYLLAGRWVSTVQLRLILDIVRQIEGDEVADQIDEVVYEWRGQNILSQVRRRYRERGWRPPR